jgi:hypothetical protein
MKKITLVITSVLMWAAGLGAADLPVRQVILYKHGVGFFQRSGELRAGETARLDFNAAEMNDVLKSLTIVEKGGGKVSGLRYDSSDPLEKKLAEYPFRLGPGQPLSAVLDQLKGAIIELKFGAETVRGAILNGRVIPGDDKKPPSEQLTLLLDTGDMRNFDLATATSVRLIDATLQTQFKEYLADLVGARSKEKRSVYIDSTGTQNRQITAEYMVPMPVWKSSYRLIFGSGAAGESTLEGWAIVDNTTGEDWNGVELSLVSGRPISFISRLYEPRYINRPTAELPEDRAQAPVLYQGAMDEKKDANAPTMQRAEMMGSVGGMAKAMAAPRAPANELPLNGRNIAELTDVTSTVAAAAASQELGELFEYRFGGAVTIHKNESAMLPFLQDKLTARRLLVYTSQSTVNPFNSAEITNSTGKTLDGGPITVYEDNAYAGEALIETLKTGDKRLISYGLDLGTRVTTAFDSKGEIVREVHLRRGVMTAKTAAVELKTYTIRNVDQKAKTLIIEHPVRSQYKVTDQKPIETTPSAYRFEVKLAANSTEKLPVTEERVYDTTIALTNLTPDVLVSYVQNKNLSDATRAQIQQILDRKRQIAAADAEARRTDEQIKSVFQDQERIRQNLNSLNRVSGQEQQVQAYSRQLAAQEAQLATLRDHLSEQQKRKAALEAELNSLIEKMEF